MAGLVPAIVVFVLSFRNGPKEQTSDAQLRIGESRIPGLALSANPG
ncbi:hypothetical protein R3F74_00815 [Bradyrhizobium japonicum]|nr:hypothetical protein [Bradyrhizobium japonicum]MCS3982398.1 hypothetical protein [Bradyrhizobium japonicum]MEB2670461.1 hypothetical protein [Bradyrhizobium japonicum]WRI71785.1 hypothetical protein RZE83_00815 [Bradyrhizobium japonicum]WRI89809.1 hypothetical protein R3F75_02260 [Bradyrhizobium japonicum]WRJ74547.1 hypothetical protein R3F74_00815 [Bradyrhizobium japonicum]